MNMKLIGNNSSVFEIKIKRRSNPNSTHEWDRKWLIVNVNLKLSGFISNFDTEILIDDLNFLDDSLSKFTKEITLLAEFKTLEETIYFKIGKHDNNQFLCSGFLKYPAGSSNKLNFAFECDIGAINSFIKDMESAKMNI